MVTLRIQAIYLREYQIPLVKPWRTARDYLSGRKGFVLQVDFVTSSGELVPGSGEVAPFPLNEDLEKEKLLHYLEAISGMEPFQLNLSRLRIEYNSEGLSYLPLRNALECALLDAWARCENKPLAGLIRQRVSSRIPINAVITTEDLVEGDWRKKITGFTTIKIKVGILSPEEEISLLRENFGSMKSGLSLRLDPNRKWDFHTCCEFLTQIKNLSIEYVEEPLREEDLSYLEEVEQKTGVPLALDETLQDIEFSEYLLKQRKISALVLKPLREGGFNACLSWHKLAGSFGVKTVLSSALESHLGTVFNLHLWNILGEPYPAGFSTLTWFDGGFVREEVKIVHGKMILPPGRGLGITLRQQDSCWQDRWQRVM